MSQKIAPVCRTCQHMRIDYTYTYVKGEVTDSLVKYGCIKRMPEDPDSSYMNRNRTRCADYIKDNEDEG